LSPGEPARPAAVARAVRALAGNGRRRDRLFGTLLGTFREMLEPGEREILQAELGDDPAVLFAAAAVLVALRHPLGKACLENRIREAARQRVEAQLEDLGTERLAPVLYGVLYAALRREFGLERTHHVPRLSFDEALEFLRRCLLPGPDTLPAGAWALLFARARLGLTQREMAARLGVTRRAYSAMERGRRDVPAGVLEQLRAVFQAA